ncbi:phage replication protein P [Escherichia coli SHECO002]|nr:phage replication protein P [Escherichia coli SHECO002]
MKNIAAQMVNFDREQMRRIANNMPEQYDEKPQVQQVAQIINGVFSQLLATFPASLANRDQNEVNEIRRQWVLAFRENGITSMEQVNAGMRVARRQNRPFLKKKTITRAVCCMVPGRSIRYRRTAKRQRAG